MANLQNLIKQIERFDKPKISTLQKGTLLLVRIESGSEIAHYSLNRGDVALYLNEVLGFNEVESDDMSFEIFDLLPYSKNDIALICYYTGEIEYQDLSLPELLKKLSPTNIQNIARIIASDNYSEFHDEFFIDKIKQVSDALMNEINQALNI